VEWASAVKELLFITLLIDLFVPIGIATVVTPGSIAVAAAAWMAKVFVVSVAVTLTESTNAKLRLFRVPELLAISLGLGFLALTFRFL
jgi:formate hydrogenlyase subunit 4